MKKVFVLINKNVLANAVIYLQSLQSDGSIEVEFRPKKTTKSEKQNSALWAVAYPPVMEEMGLRGEKSGFISMNIFAASILAGLKK